MKINVDVKRREQSFLVGNQVYLKLQPYWQQSSAKRPFEKLSPRVFHISQLKRAIRHYIVAPTLPEQLTSLHGTHGGNKDIAGCLHQGPRPDHQERSTVEMDSPTSR